MAFATAYDTREMFGFDENFRKNGYGHVLPSGVQAQLQAQQDPSHPHSA
jgi:hypothetical protein